MSDLQIRRNLLGFELTDGERPIAQYRACEELPADESPKPCFAPIYTGQGTPITEYRPADHRWHTGLYFGWVHANQANLWGGGWFLPEKGHYEDVPGTHGAQRHVAFAELGMDGGAARVDEELTWVDAAGEALAAERRHYVLGRCDGGYLWQIRSRVEPAGDALTLGATRAEAAYSGLILRMGPAFTRGDGARHLSSEGAVGHEATMHSRARWVGVEGADDGMVVMMDHPANPRHPAPWFTRANLLGTAPLMDGDLTIGRGQALELCYGFAVLDEPVPAERVETLYSTFASS